MRISWQSRNIRTGVFEGIEGEFYGVYIYTADKIVFKRALKEAGDYIARLGKKFLVIIDPFFAESPAMEDLTRYQSAGSTI